MFSQDRDLVVFEPGLMRDVAWAGQRRLSTVGGISGTQLTITTGSFVDAGVTGGHVVLFDGITLEVVSVDSPTTASVSLMRADVLGASVPPLDAPARTMSVTDFSPQRAIVHRQILSMLGLDATSETAHGADASSVTNPGALRRLETLGTLHLIYAGASAPARGVDRYEQRAALYLERFRRERESVVAMIDTDGDGIAEVVRRPNVHTLGRG